MEKILGSILGKSVQTTITNMFIVRIRTKVNIGNKFDIMEAVTRTIKLN